MRDASRYVVYVGELFIAVLFGGKEDEIVRECAVVRYIERGVVIVLLSAYVVLRADGVDSRVQFDDVRPVRQDDPLRR